MGTGKIDGSGVHIGVVDSLGQPPTEVGDIIDIDSVNDDYTATEMDDPIGHGSDVLQITSFYAPDATFSTFQMFDEFPEDNKVGGSRSAAIAAISDAAAMGIDILNLSIGVPVMNGGHECGGYCALARETRATVDSGVCVVAAAGNIEDINHRYGVHCPAQVDSVISVAGYVPYCSHDIQDKANTSQWWVDKDDKRLGPFCGQCSCCNSASCEEHREESLWRGNVDFYNTVPDILGPVLYVSNIEGEPPNVQLGTSFAAPIITGLIASALSESAVSTDELDPRTIQNAISLGSTLLDDDSLYKYNHKNTVRELLSAEPSF